MTIERLLAQLTVTDLTASVAWYSTLFGRAPDAEPMPGLVEWHLAETFGVQVFLEPDRAGRSAIVVDESDLDARAAALDRVGLEHGGLQDVTSSRILPLTDPDGNRIVFTGPFAA